jgi:hypothetical protein
MGNVEAFRKIMEIAATKRQASKDLAERLQARDGYGD